MTADPVRVRVSADGQEAFEGEAWQVVVANTGAFGAGAQIDPADPTDGRLDVAVIAAGSRAALVRRAYGMRTGTLV